LYYKFDLSLGTTNEIRKSTKKNTNNIFAAEFALAAIPPKPKIAAMRATIKKVKDQL